MTRLGLIIDLDKCYGCDSCNLACQKEHLWPVDVPFIHVRKEPVNTPNRLTPPMLCMHCDDPACVSHCDVGAIQLDDDGIAHIELNQCTGCGECISACPYGAVGLTKIAADDRLRSMMSPQERALSTLWGVRRSRQIPSKCDLCADRRKAGQRPVCVSICPVGAIAYGDFDDPGSDVHPQLTDSRVVTVSPPDGTHTRPRVYYRLPEGVDAERLKPLLNRLIFSE